MILRRARRLRFFIDISLDVEQGLRTLEQIRQNAPDAYVILSATNCTQDFLLRSMRLGSADFLQQPLKRAEFSEAMTRLDQHSQRIQRQERQLGRMYSFVGVKGGVGTTTAAINFAATCAKHGKSTVLVDLDMDSGDAACYLGLRHQYSLADLVAVSIRWTRRCSKASWFAMPSGFMSCVRRRKSNDRV